MIHPAAIYAVQQKGAFQLTHIVTIGGQLFLALAVKLEGDIEQTLFDLILIQLAQLVLMPGDFGGRHAQAPQIFGQAVKLPQGGIGIAALVSDSALDELLDHADDVIVDVLAFQHLTALLIDQLALLVHDVIVLQHVLADFVVAAFHALLGVFDLAGQQLCIQRGILVHAQAGGEHLHPFAAEDAQQIVLHGDEELAAARIALTAGAAAQLIVDAAAFVALGAQDVQAAQGNHAVVRHIGFFFILGAQLGIVRTGGEHHVGHVLVMAGGQLDDLVLIALLPHGAAGHVIRVAAQQDIRATARHVGGDGDGAVMAGLCHDGGLAGMMLGV